MRKLSAGFCTAQEMQTKNIFEQPLLRCAANRKSDRGTEQLCEDNLEAGCTFVQPFLAVWVFTEIIVAWRFQSSVKSSYKLILTGNSYEKFKILSIS